MISNPDFIDLLRELNKEEVRYVLVGGLAVIFHGHFRSTKDMDLYYEATEENVSKIIQAIKAFGFGSLNFSVADFMDKTGYIKMGKEPNRIDMLCDLPGISFDEVYESAHDYVEEGVPVKVIHVNQLIANKKAVGRLQDLDDVKKLQKILNKRKS